MGKGMQKNNYRFICVTWVIGLVLFFCMLIAVGGYAQGTWTVYTNASTGGGLVSDIVNATEVDGAGNKWFGTNNGVSKFNGGWTTYTIADGLVSNTVQAIVIDGLGNKWFGTDGGVSKFNGGWTNYTTADGLVDDNVYAVAIDGLGNKWFGTNNGVNRFDGGWTNYTTADGLVHKNVNAIVVDAEGNKWFGTNGGVSKFDGAVWTSYTNATTGGGLVDDQVRSIAIDAEGNKWFGTNDGVSKFDGAVWTSYTNATTGGGLVDDKVRSIAIDAEGNKWFGTIGGVSLFSTPPGAPILSSPSNGATGISTSPTLIWNISVGATSYILQVSLVIDFSSFVFNQNVGNVTSKQISGVLVGTKYYWRVNASNIEGTSAWSSVWSFSTSNTGISNIYKVSWGNIIIISAVCMFYGTFIIIRKMQ